MSKTRTLPPKLRPRSARHVEAPRTACVRIIVADSQAIDRGGLGGLIDDERDLEVVGEAATLEETIRQCSALKPDVLVLALNLAGQEERPALPAIRTALPKLKVLALAAPPRARGRDGPHLCDRHGLPDPRRGPGRHGDSATPRGPRGAVPRDPRRGLGQRVVRLGDRRVAAREGRPRA